MLEYKHKPDDMICPTALGFRLQRYISDEIDAIYQFHHGNFSYAAIYRDILKSWADNRIRKRNIIERKRKHDDIMLRIRNRKFSKIKMACEIFRDCLNNQQDDVLLSR